MTRYFASVLALLLLSPAAHADQTHITVPAGSAVLDISLAVPAKARILEISASSAEPSRVDLYLKDGAPFDAARPLFQQSAFHAGVSPDGPARLAIGTYSTPALHAGTWQLAVANSGAQAVTISLETAISYTTEVRTPFVVSFEEPSQALVDYYGGADNLDCHVGPWTDDTPLGDSTLGAYRRSLVSDTAAKLATQVHSPVPVHIQACWADRGGAAADGSYTLASANTLTYFRDVQGMPMAHTWYAFAAANRMAGHRLCGVYSDVDCAIPDIIVWYNSNEVAADAFNGVRPAGLIRALTMHEITHGLGFLSMLDVSSGDDDFLKFYEDSSGHSYPDAYIKHVAWLPADVQPPYGHTQVLPFVDLSHPQRLLAIKSGNYLVWNAPAMAASTMNALRGNEPPLNLVQLYAPQNINPGSTLSHFNDAAHPGQLMDHFIQPNHPQVLGLAEPVLEKVGWSTGPLPDVPITGTWSDPAHSGHGIDLELTNRAPAGDIYSLLFYTFDAEGQPEYYGAALRLVDGRMASLADPAAGAVLLRPVYDPAAHEAIFPDGPSGTVIIDFTDAISDPACDGHEREPMALMRWSLSGEKATWCISPVIGPELRPANVEDLSGVWNAGSSDSGWGLTLTELDIGGTSQVTSLLFYYDDDNQSRWGITDLSAYAPGAAVDIYQSTGYCRSCAKAPLTTVQIGTLTLDFSYPENVELPSGDNTLSADIDAQNRYFQRQNTAMRLLSLPAGQ